MTDTATPRDRNEERAIRIARTNAAKAAIWAQNIPAVDTYQKRTR